MSKRATVDKGIGERLKAIRKRLGVNQTDFALALGFKYQGGYQKVESGHHAPSLDMLRLLREKFGISEEEVLVGARRPALVKRHRIAAGTGREVVDENEEVEVPALVAERVDYALLVEGHSMVGDHILDGDLLFIQRREEPPAREGAIVVVWRREDNVATLKHVHRHKGGKIELRSSNPDICPAFTWEGGDDNVRVQGVPVGLLRRFKQPS